MSSNSNTCIVSFGFRKGFVGAVDGLPKDVAHDHVFVEGRVARTGTPITAEACCPEGARAVPPVVHAGAQDALDEVFGGVFVPTVNTSNDADLAVDDAD